MSQLVSAPVGRAGGRTPAWCAWMPRDSTRFDTTASLSSRFSVPAVQFHDCFPAPLVYLAVIVVGMKGMLNSAHSFNGKVHRLLSRVGRRRMEDQGLTNRLVLNTPATTSRSAPGMTASLSTRGDRELTIIAGQDSAPPFPSQGGS